MTALEDKSATVRPMSDGNWFTRFMSKEVGAISLRVASAACYGATAAAAVVTVLIFGANLKDADFSQMAIPTMGSFVCAYVLLMLATHFRNQARSAEAAAARDETVELIGTGKAAAIELSSTPSISAAGNIAASTAAPIDLPATSSAPAIDSRG